jgi:hypothetical protein
MELLRHSIMLDWRGVWMGRGLTGNKTGSKQDEIARETKTKNRRLSLSWSEKRIEIPGDLPGHHGMIRIRQSNLDTVKSGA